MPYFVPYVTMMWDITSVNLPFPLFLVTFDKTCCKLDFCSCFFSQKYVLSLFSFNPWKSCIPPPPKSLYSLARTSEMYPCAHESTQNTWNNARYPGKQCFKMNICCCCLFCVKRSRSATAVVQTIDKRVAKDWHSLHLRSWTLCHMSHSLLAQSWHEKISSGGSYHCHADPGVHHTTRDFSSPPDSFPFPNTSW